MALRTFASSGKYLYLDISEVEDMRRVEASEPRRLPSRSFAPRDEFERTRPVGADGTDKKRSDR